MNTAKVLQLLQAITAAASFYAMGVHVTQGSLWWMGNLAFGVVFAGLSLGYRLHISRL